MSSTPFCLEIPVIDNPDGNAPDAFVLRATDEKQAKERIEHFRKFHSKSTRIKLHRIGYRPDKPVPVAMLFYEVSVEKNPNEQFGFLEFPWVVYGGLAQETGP